MRIKINGKIFKAKEGATILEICRHEKIKIPTLCSMENSHEGVCRICLVEISGKLITSCNTLAQEGMEIETESENVQKGRRINLELLWADHAGKCATCKKNQMCELQKLAEEYQIENFHFVPRKGEITPGEELDLMRDNWSRVVVEKESSCVLRNSEFCIECRRCINICPEKKFGMNYRAGDSIVGTPFEKKLDCGFCGLCVEVCPTAALTDQNDYARIFSDLNDLKKFSVAILDVGIEKKILDKICKISPEKDVRKILNSLGFERIVNLEKKDSEDEIIENIKNKQARKEKMDPKNILTFFISSKIQKKAVKNNCLDYILSEREVAQIFRDKKKMGAGKMI